MENGAREEQSGPHYAAISSPINRDIRRAACMINELLDQYVRNSPIIFSPRGNAPWGKMVEPGSDAGQECDACLEMTIRSLTSQS